MVAFDTRGHRLGAPDIRLFEDESRRNWASRFRNGVAENIPFGTYRVEGRLIGFYSDVRYARVYQSQVTVILGLTIGNEAPIFPPILRGRVVGIASESTRKDFVKLIGVFSSISLESEIGSNGEFEMSGLTDGIYLLLIAGEDGVLASQVIDIPYKGPLEVKIAK